MSEELPPPCPTPLRMRMRNTPRPSIDPPSIKLAATAAPGAAMASQQRGLMFKCLRLASGHAPAAGLGAGKVAASPSVAAVTMEAAGRAAATSAAATCSGSAAGGLGLSRMGHATAAGATATGLGLAAGGRCPGALPSSSAPLLLRQQRAFSSLPVRCGSAGLPSGPRTAGGALPWQRLAGAGSPGLLAAAAKPTHSVGAKLVTMATWSLPKLPTALSSGVGMVGGHACVPFAVPLDRRLARAVGDPQTAWQGVGCGSSISPRTPFERRCKVQP